MIKRSVIIVSGIPYLLKSRATITISVFMSWIGIASIHGTRMVQELYKNGTRIVQECYKNGTRMYPSGKKRHMMDNKYLLPSL